MDVGAESLDLRGSGDALPLDIGLLVRPVSDVDHYPVVLVLGLSVITSDVT